MIFMAVLFTVASVWEKIPEGKELHKPQTYREEFTELLE